MAVAKHTNLTLNDLRIAGVANEETVDIISRKKAIVDNLTWKPTNKQDTHVVPIRAGYADAFFSRYYKGVPNTAGRLVHVTDICAKIKSRSAPDKDLIDDYEDSAKARYELDIEHQEGMATKFADNFWYGDIATNPDGFMGITPRFNSTKAANAENILDGGGKSNKNTSIWLLCHDDRVMHGIYPKATKAGLGDRDLGVIQVPDDANNMYSAYGREYFWNCGLTIRDWRYIVRIANIDVSTLQADPSKGGADLVKLMGDALETLYDLNMNKITFYANKTVIKTLRSQFQAQDHVRMDLEEVGGRHVRVFDSIPVERDDSLINAEDAVV